MKLLTLLVATSCLTASAFGVSPLQSQQTAALKPALRKDTAVQSPLFRDPLKTRGGAVPGWAAYNDSLDKNPLTTKALTSLVGWALGDFLAQVRYVDDFEFMFMGTAVSSDFLSSSCCVGRFVLAWWPTHTLFCLSYCFSVFILVSVSVRFPFLFCLASANDRSSSPAERLTWSASSLCLLLDSSTMDLPATTFMTGSTSSLKEPRLHELPWRLLLTKLSGVQFSWPYSSPTSAWSTEIHSPPSEARSRTTFLRQSKDRGRSGLLSMPSTSSSSPPNTDWSLSTEFK